MGMYTVPLFTNRPEALVNLERLRQLRRRGFAEDGFLSDDAIATGTHMRLDAFLQLCEGKLMAYVSGTMMMAWDAIASCVSEPASLYFHYEEGDVIRIDCDPTTQRLLDGEHATMFAQMGRAEWHAVSDYKLLPPRSHPMTLRSKPASAPLPMPVTAPFPLPTRAELQARMTSFHTPNINLARFYDLDTRGLLKWRRVDTDDMRAWMW